VVVGGYCGGTASGRLADIVVEKVHAALAGSMEGLEQGGKIRPAGQVSAGELEAGGWEDELDGGEERQQLRPGQR
jgi:hypothetical protein